MKTLIGFLAGAVSALGLATAKHHVRMCRCGCGHGHECHCTCASCRRRRLLHQLLAHLDAGPSQENAIRTAVEQCADRLHGHMRAMRDSARDVARAVRAERLDEDLLRQVFSRHDELLGQVRDEVVNLLRRIHETLDESQRERLARLIESWHGWRHGMGSFHHRCG